jgi:hypothetical protein
MCWNNSLSIIDVLDLATKTLLVNNLLKISCVLVNVVVAAKIKIYKKKIDIKNQVRFKIVVKKLQTLELEERNIEERVIYTDKVTQ